MLERLVWPFCDRFVLVLGSGQVHLVRQLAWKRKPTAQLLETVPLPVPSSMEAVKQALTHVLQKWPTHGRALSVVLGPEWVQFSHIVSPPNVRRIPDLVAAASMQLQKMMDAPPQDMAVACDPASHPAFLGSAMHRPLLSLICELAAERRMQLCGVVPEFATVWNHWCAELKTGEWLAVCVPNGLAMGLAAHGRLQTVRHKRLPDAGVNTAQWLQDTVAQEALRHNMDAPAGLALCGQVPSAWLGVRAGQPSKGLSCRLLGEAAGVMAVLGVAP